MTSDQVSRCQNKKARKKHAASGPARYQPDKASTFFFCYPALVSAWIKDLLEAMIFNQPSGNVPAMNGSRPFATLSNMTEIPEDLTPDPKGVGDFKRSLSFTLQDFHII